jgi:hypothetical protein
MKAFIKWPCTYSGSVFAKLKYNMIQNVDFLPGVFIYFVVFFNLVLHLNAMLILLIYYCLNRS